MPGKSSKPPKIIWKKMDDTSNRPFGHGVLFVDTSMDGEDAIVAFLDGFAWLHGFSDEAVIHCINPNTRTSEAVLSTMKKRIEAILLKGKIPSGKITERIRALVSG